jgi:hypothetical protein
MRSNKAELLSYTNLLEGTTRIAYQVLDTAYQFIHRAKRLQCDCMYRYISVLLSLSCLLLLPPPSSLRIVAEFSTRLAPSLGEKCIVAWRSFA